MTIRPATFEDLEAIVAVHLPSFQAAHDPLLAPERAAEFTAERRRAGWEPVLRNLPARSTVLVKESEGEVIGVTGAGPARDDDLDPATTGELYALYVHPDGWGAGHGRELHAAAIAHLQREGFADAILWMLEGNDVARAFYEAHGWRPEGARGEWHGATRVRLRREV